MDAERIKAIRVAAVLVFLVVVPVVSVWSHHIRRKRHEAFVRWQESEAGKDFRWVEKDGQGEAPGGIDIGFG